MPIYNQAQRRPRQSKNETKVDSAHLRPQESWPVFRTTYTIGIYRDGKKAAQSRALLTVHHPSWQRLSAVLGAVVIEEPQLTDLKAKLEAESACEISRSLSMKPTSNGLGLEFSKMLFRLWGLSHFWLHQSPLHSLTRL